MIPSGKWVLLLALLGPSPKSVAGQGSAGQPPAIAAAPSFVMPFTCFPVDLAELFAGPGFRGTAPITPFFSYDNTAHAEGARKWYLYGSLKEPMKVFLPARASLSAQDFRASEDSRELTVNGERVRANLNATFRVSSEVSIIFMHLALRETVAREVEQSAGRCRTLDAGTHIGYVHNPPWQSLDFGVEDRSKPSGMAADPELWWNVRANPLDYFEPRLREQILKAYGPVRDRLRQDGTVAYSDLSDSRGNIQVGATLWGVWFKEGLEDPFRQHRVNWSIINLVPTRMLHRDSYWRALKEDPDHIGLLTENGQGETLGPSLYPDGPMGRSRLYLESGGESRGTLRLQTQTNPARKVYLKFQVIAPDPKNPFLDRLELECTDPAQARGGFSDRAVWFGRSPTRMSPTR